MSHARGTVTVHNPTWKVNFTHTPRGEKELRTIVEEIQRTIPRVTFRTSDVPGRGDMLFMASHIVQCDGKPHARQSVRDHDAYMMSKVTEEGFRVWRFKESEILFHRLQVKQILASIAVMELAEADRLKQQP